MDAAEVRRRASHQHHDPSDGRDHPNEVTCGSCGRSWCYTCHPTPAYLCPWDNGDDVDSPRPAAIRKRRGVTA